MRHAYSARNPDEFLAALEKAQADGTISEWTYGMLSGEWAPIGTDEYRRRFPDEESVT